VFFSCTALGAAIVQPTPDDAQLEVRHAGLLSSQLMIRDNTCTVYEAVAHAQS